MGKVKFNFRIGQTVYWKETYSIPSFQKCNGGSIKERVTCGIVDSIQITINKGDYRKYQIETTYNIIDKSEEIIDMYEYRLHLNENDVR